MILHFALLVLLSHGLLGQLKEGEVDVSEAIDGDSRIINGKDATPGMANYQVAMRGHSGRQEWNKCGGSILNDEYVLTSAVCIYEVDTKDMSVMVGSHMVNRGDQYMIKKLIPHEKFVKKTLKNDIGIVQIEGKFKFSDKVQPIELLKEMAPIGKKCLLTGWGYIDLKRRRKPNNLQMLEYETISNDDCNKQLKGTDLPEVLPVDAGQLCAKSPKNKGSCHGDNGSPLVIQDDKKKNLQIGVSSWGIPCAKGYPGVFTSVHGFNDWIQGKIK